MSQAASLGAGGPPQTPDDTALQKLCAVVVDWLKKNAPSAVLFACLGTAFGFLANVVLTALARYGWISPPRRPSASGVSTLSLCWMLASTLLFAIFGYWRSVGTAKFLEAMRNLPGSLASLFQAGGSAAGVHLLWGAGTTFVVSLVISPSLGAVVGLALLAGMPTVIGSIVSSMLFRVWGALVAFVSPTKRAPLEGAVMMAIGALGSAAALLLAVVLTSMQLKLALAAICAVAALALSGLSRRSVQTAIVAWLCFSSIAPTQWRAIGAPSNALAQNTNPYLDSTPIFQAAVEKMCKDFTSSHGWQICSTNTGFANGRWTMAERPPYLKNQTRGMCADVAKVNPEKQSVADAVEGHASFNKYVLQDAQVGNYRAWSAAVSDPEEKLSWPLSFASTWVYVQVDNHYLIVHRDGSMLGPVKDLPTRNAMRAQYRADAFATALELATLLDQTLQQAKRQQAEFDQAQAAKRQQQQPQAYDPSKGILAPSGDYILKGAGDPKRTTEVPDNLTPADHALDPALFMLLAAYALSCGVGGPLGAALGAALASMSSGSPWWLNAKGLPPGLFGSSSLEVGPPQLPWLTLDNAQLNQDASAAAGFYRTADGGLDLEGLTNYFNTNYGLPPGNNCPPWMDEATFAQAVALRDLAVTKAAEINALDVNRVPIAPELFGLGAPVDCADLPPEAFGLSAGGQPIDPADLPVEPPPGDAQVDRLAVTAGSVDFNDLPGDVPETEDAAANRAEIEHLQRRAAQADFDRQQAEQNLSEIQQQLAGLSPLEQASFQNDPSSYPEIRARIAQNREQIADANRTSTWANEQLRDRSATAGGVDSGYGEVRRGEATVEARQDIGKDQFDQTQEQIEKMGIAAGDRSAWAMNEIDRMRDSIFNTETGAVNLDEFARLQDRLKAEHRAQQQHTEATADNLDASLEQATDVARTMRDTGAAAAMMIGAPISWTGAAINGAYGAGVAASEGGDLKDMAKAAAYGVAMPMVYQTAGLVGGTIIGGAEAAYHTYAAGGSHEDAAWAIAQSTLFQVGFHGLHKAQQAQAARPQVGPDIGRVKKDGPRPYTDARGVSKDLLGIKEQVRPGGPRPFTSPAKPGFEPPTSRPAVAPGGSSAAPNITGARAVASTKGGAASSNDPTPPTTDANHPSAPRGQTNTRSNSPPPDRSEMPAAGAYDPRDPYIQEILDRRSSLENARRDLVENRGLRPDDPVVKGLGDRIAETQQDLIRRSHQQAAESGSGRPVKGTSIKDALSDDDGRTAGFSGHKDDVSTEAVNRIRNYGRRYDVDIKPDGSTNVRTQAGNSVGDVDVPRSQNSWQIRVNKDRGTYSIEGRGQGSEAAAVRALERQAGMKLKPQEHYTPPEVDTSKSPVYDVDAPVNRGSRPDGNEPASSPPRTTGQSLADDVQRVDQRNALRRQIEDNHSVRDDLSRRIRDVRKTRPNDSAMLEGLENQRKQLKIETQRLRKAENSLRPDASDNFRTEQVRDPNGRIQEKKIEGELGHSDDVRHHRDQPAQNRVTRAAIKELKSQGITPDKGDIHAAHLAPNVGGAPGGVENLVAVRGDTNLSHMRSVENFAFDAQRAGATVHWEASATFPPGSKVLADTVTYQVRLEYPPGHPQAGRPENFEVVLNLKTEHAYWSRNKIPVVSDKLPYVQQDGSIVYEARPFMSGPQPGDAIG